MIFLIKIVIMAYFLCLEQILKLMNQSIKYQPTYISTLCSLHIDFLHFYQGMNKSMLSHLINIRLFNGILLFCIMLWPYITPEFRKTMFRIP